MSESNPWKFTTLLLFGAIIGYGFSSFAGPAPTTLETSVLDGETVGGGLEVEDEEVEEEIIFVDASEDDDAFLGDADSPIVMVEFSDFQCPYCQRFVEETLPAIEANYIDTGLVKLVYRDYPLDFHANATLAAEAAECAGDGQDYWEMHDMLFERLSEWSSLPDPTDTFVAYANEIGFYTTSFSSCLENHDMLSEVQADMIEGASYGVSGTPSFFINGYMVVGAQPYEVFEQIFEAALAQ
ncbi:MAG: thioredoxin domain-containing protein [Candidatus Peregrinibacteria bacterium]|nr:thioredoxin domain-containing protein [Candidatus Peregrinibacteria bacterium]